MPIVWNKADVLEFLGESASLWENDRMFFFDSAGPVLRYRIWVDEITEFVIISGVDELPFQGDSLYEFSIPCDSIRVAGDGYHPNQESLEFWFGPMEENKNCADTMRLSKFLHTLEFRTCNCPSIPPMARFSKDSEMNNQSMR